METEPAKLCECGCGQPSPIAKQTDTKKGYIKGQSIRFINGHNGSGVNNPKWKGMVKVNCAWCGKEKDIIPYSITRSNNFFCDFQCHGKWKGNNIVGKNNPNWQGGLSFEPYCPIFSGEEFKESIRERDARKCQNPYCYGNIRLNHALSVHHIDYDKKECRPDNLITLCLGCNNRANKDREWHTAWYQAILYRQNKLIHRQKGSEQ